MGHKRCISIHHPVFAGEKKKKKPCRHHEKYQWFLNENSIPNKAKWIAVPT